VRALPSPAPLPSRLGSAEVPPSIPRWLPGHSHASTTNCMSDQSISLPPPPIVPAQRALNLLVSRCTYYSVFLSLGRLLVSSLPLYLSRIPFPVPSPIIPRTTRPRSPFFSFSPARCIRASLRRHTCRTRSYLAYAQKRARAPEYYRGHGS